MASMTVAASSATNLKLDIPPFTAEGDGLQDQNCAGMTCQSVGGLGCQQLDPTSVLSPRVSRLSHFSSGRSRQSEFGRSISDCLTCNSDPMQSSPMHEKYATSAFGSPMCLSPSMDAQIQLPSTLSPTLSPLSAPAASMSGAHSHAAPCSSAAPQAVQPLQHQGASGLPKLMIFNLNPLLARQHLEAAFSKFGPLHSLVPLRASKTSLAACVLFQQAKDAGTAMATLQGVQVPLLSLPGKPLSVQVHMPKTQATSTSAPTSATSLLSSVKAAASASATDYLAAARSMLTGTPAAAVHLLQHQPPAAGLAVRTAPRTTVRETTQQVRAPHMLQRSTSVGMAAHGYGQGPMRGQQRPAPSFRWPQWPAPSAPRMPSSNGAATAAVAPAFRRQLSAPMQTVQEHPGRAWGGPQPQQLQQPMWPQHPQPATTQLLLDAGACLSKLADDPASAAATSLHALHELLASGDPVLMQLAPEQPGMAGPIVVGAVVEDPLRHHQVALLAASMRLTLEGLHRQGISLPM